MWRGVHGLARFGAQAGAVDRHGTSVLEAAKITTQCSSIMMRGMVEDGA